jgi:hypothetical protein
MSRRQPLGIAIALSVIATALGAQPSPKFGTSQTSYVTLGPSEFNPLNSDDGFVRGFLLNATSGSGTFYATAHLPSGALVTYFEFDYCDTNASGKHVTVKLEDCPTVGDCSAPTLVTSLTSMTTLFCGSISVQGFSYTVDNTAHRLFLVATMSSLDSTNEFGGAKLGYNLQVSPAPAFAQFNDVPTTDWAFQFIEALAKAGITTGCSIDPPLYCPDSQITRREMAVFLAVALGL